jgi:hypothetical protein
MMSCQSALHTEVDANHSSRIATELKMSESRAGERERAFFKCFADRERKRRIQIKPIRNLPLQGGLRLIFSQGRGSW